MKLRLLLPSSRPPPRWLFGLLVGTAAVVLSLGQAPTSGSRRDRQLRDALPLRRDVEPALGQRHARPVGRIGTAREAVGDSDRRGSADGGHVQLRDHDGRRDRRRDRRQPVGDAVRHDRQRQVGPGREPSDRSDGERVPPARQRLLHPCRVAAEQRFVDVRRRHGQRDRRPQPVLPQAQNRVTIGTLVSPPSPEYDDFSPGVYDQPTPTSITPADTGTLTTPNGKGWIVDGSGGVELPGRDMDVPGEIHRSRQPRPRHRAPDGRHVEGDDVRERDHQLDPAHRPELLGRRTVRREHDELRRWDGSRRRRRSPTRSASARSRCSRTSTCTSSTSATRPRA